MTAEEVPLANGELELFSFNVGWGDARFISAPNGENVLVDADTSALTGELQAALAERTDHRTADDTIRIDYTVVTHIDQDHVAGLASVPSRYDVQHVVEPDPSRYMVQDAKGGNSKRVSIETMSTYEDSLEQLDVETTSPVSAGDTLPLESETEIEVVAPPATEEPVEFENPAADTNSTLSLKPDGANANSIVLKVDGDRSALLMGDIEDTAGHNAESWLVHRHHDPESDVDLDADVLMVGHHGSGNATSKALLDAVGPQWIGISSSLDNPSDHPNYETLDRIDQYTEHANSELSVYWTAYHGRNSVTLSDGLATAHADGTTAMTAADLAAWKYETLKPDVVAKGQANAKRRERDATANTDDAWIFGGEPARSDGTDHGKSL